eukprot:TRINITY_DN87707_c0_g1_i1.p1 TRINITY_DN87707_c0_g1~~TRINITY_DN87707_c0_g1_i1.p1  ORF type:complete len:170 (+),score=32.23 TRINITY_DN87707_c0_g1_i1:129-638(+)
MGQTSCRPEVPEAAFPPMDCRTGPALCRQNCSERDARDLRDLPSREVLKAVHAPPEQSKKQLQQAQRVVDRTLQSLGIGLEVQLSGESQHLRISEDLKTLEIISLDDGLPKRRLPLSQVVDVSFGSSSKSLLLRFSDAMCREPLDLHFSDEERRLEIALTLKVLRARLP